ncbi:hypothetical protein RR46_12027 [Papilio xuthus]|uniref:Uncharacterized protein n=1 Tax=Papilio xuthus TaxID=66420 RepID=A0A194PPX8_PAPXU|nr:hypothetical protein RR46_12027 [Papilio xuthus]
MAAQKHSTASFDQEKLVQFVSGYGSLEIAAEAGEYLTGLGDYTDAAGVRHTMVARESNRDGHIGTATAETHGFCENLPAPAILQRVAEDLRTTVNRQDFNDARLRNGIVPRVTHIATTSKKASGRCGTRRCD